jgi:hypothetical protein
LKKESNPRPEDVGAKKPPPPNNPPPLPPISCKLRYYDGNKVYIGDPEFEYACREFLMGCSK